MNGMSQSSEALNVDYIGLTAAVVSAYLSNNHVQSAEIVALIAATHAALYGVGQSNATAAARPVEGLAPTQIRKSITHDALISFEDGKAYKTLGRHLRSRGLTPKTYREKWGLPRDYPMVAAGYSEQRSALAKSFGLGQQRRKAASKAAVASEVISEKSKRVGRPRKAAEPVEA